MAKPFRFAGREFAIGPPEELQKLAHRIEIAVAGGIEAETECLVTIRIEERRRGLEVEKTITALPELPTDMLCEAASR